MLLISIYANVNNHQINSSTSQRKQNNHLLIVHALFQTYCLVCVCVWFTQECNVANNQTKLRENSKKLST